MLIKATSILHPPKAPVGNCPLFCCSGVVRKEGLIDILEPNLQNDIHPVVSESTFEGCPEIDYAPLDQALRLLSNLIEQSLPMYYTIFFGDLRLVSQSRDKRQYEFINEVKVLTEEQKEMTRHRLEEMKCYVYFELNQDDEEDGAESYTQRTSFTPDDEFFKAESMICISNDVYNDVVENSQPNADPIKKFASIFRFAKEIGHELIHAALLNSRPESFLRKGETQAAGFFFEGGRGSEEGFEWESRTFGGVIDYKYDPVRTAHQTSDIPKYQTNRVDLYQVNRMVSNFNKTIMLFQWPAQHFVDMYTDTDAQIGIRGAPVESISVGWHVRAFDIYRLSQQEYWDTDVKRLGVTALHPKLKMGYRYSTPAGGKFQPHKCSGKDINVEVFDLRGVPEGYSLSAWGLIEEAQSEEFAGVPRQFKVKVEEADEEVTMQDVPDWMPNPPQALQQQIYQIPDWQQVTRKAQEQQMMQGAPQWMSGRPQFVQEQLQEIPGWQNAVQRVEQGLANPKAGEEARYLASRTAAYASHMYPEPMKFEPAGFTPAPGLPEPMSLIPPPLAFEPENFFNMQLPDEPATPPAPAVGNDAWMGVEYDDMDVDMFGLN